MLRSVACAFFWLLLLGAPTLAAEVNFTAGTELVLHGVSKGDKLNMRGYANAKSAVIVELPPDATGLIATGRASQSGTDTWVEIKYGSKRGWVNSRYIRAQAAKPETAAQRNESPNLGFRTIDDDTTGIRVDLPTAVLDKSAVTKFGHNWSSSDDAISIDSLSFPKGERLRDVYNRLRTIKNRVLTREQLTADGFLLDGRDGDTVVFRIRAKRKGDAIRGLSVAYAANREKDFATLVDKIIGSFEAFPNVEQETKPRSVMIAEDPAPQPKARAAGEADHSTNPVADCDSNDIEKRLTGCGKLLEQPGVTPAVRAIAYSRRSDSYIERKEYAKAVADRLEALKLEPEIRERQTTCGRGAPIAGE